MGWLIALTELDVRVALSNGDIADAPAQQNRRDYGTGWPTIINQFCRIIRDKFCRTDGAERTRAAVARHRSRCGFGLCIPFFP